MENQVLKNLGGMSNISKQNIIDETTEIFFIKDFGLVHLEKLNLDYKVQKAVIKNNTVIISYIANKDNFKEDIVMAKDYQDLSKKILSNIGGKENIIYYTHCITRLRFNVKDKNAVDLENLKNLKGALGAQWSGDQLQIIIGAEVDDVFESILKVGNLESIADTNENSNGNNQPARKKWSFNSLLETLSACMVPILPALCGTGVIKGILVLMTTYFGISTENSVYLLLDTIADVAFYFMPFLVAYAASVKFKVNTIVSLMMIGLFLHPTIVGMIGTNFNLLGINLPIMNYSSTVFPALIAVWILSYVYKIVDKSLPKVLRFVLTPALSLIIMAPILLGVIGPVGYYIGYYLATFVSQVFHFNSFLGGFFLGAIRPFVLLTGMQTTFTPIIINNLSTYGYDFIWPVHSVFAMACCGMSIGAYFRSKKVSSKVSEDKEMYLSSLVSGLAGVSEPSLYGIAFRYKSQLISLILSSSISGAFVAGFGAKVYAAGNPPWLFLPGFGETMNIMAIGFILSFLLSGLLSYFAGFSNNLSFIRGEKQK